MINDTHTDNREIQREMDEQCPYRREEIIECEELERVALNMHEWKHIIRKAKDRFGSVHSLQ
jgi:hypothetical protein